MLESTAKYLETRTQEYWQLSLIRNGKLPTPMNVGTAIDRIKELTAQLGPHRKLLPRVAALSNAIVQGRKQKNQLPSATITSLRSS
jgi:hypothetical protein